MSADIYCQNLNNRQYAETPYLYSNRKKGKQARCWRDRERVCVCVCVCERERERERERESSAENRVGSVVKTAVGE